VRAQVPGAHPNLIGRYQSKREAENWEGSATRS